MTGLCSQPSLLLVAFQNTIIQLPRPCPQVWFYRTHGFKSSGVYVLRRGLHFMLALISISLGCFTFLLWAWWATPLLHKWPDWDSLLLPSDHAVDSFTYQEICWGINLDQREVCKERGSGFPHLKLWVQLTKVLFGTKHIRVYLDFYNSMTPIP